MRKALALLGLVTVSLGLGAGASAELGPGQSSSGEYKWTTACAGPGEVTFTNSPDSIGDINIVVTTGYGEFLGPGESWTSTPFAGRYEQWFIQIDGSFGAVDSGDFSDCGGTQPTTPEPTNPNEPTPSGPAGNVIRNVAAAGGGGFVAPGSEIGPGIATFGATGFTPGEQVDVVLHSTPRSLGTVTADANGVASITFEVLASDGPGEHSVVFTGPSGTVTVPFTLVLPAQTLPQTR